MKKEFKVQAISEKIELLEVNGQDKAWDCLHNCRRTIWRGNKSSKTKGCYTAIHRDAYKKKYE